MCPCNSIYTGEIISSSSSRGSQAHGLLDSLLFITTLAVEETQVAVPSQCNNIDHKNAMLKRHNLKVDKLYPWPEHPILCEGGSVCTLYLLPRRRTFHDRHGREETDEIDGCEDELIGGDTGDSGRCGFWIAT
jgi:hypothetical protein